MFSDEKDRLNNVYRVEVDSLGGGGARRYLMHYFSFVRRSLMVGLTRRFREWRPEIVWASSPPLFVGISGFVLARAFRCPFVFDVRDIWPQSAVSAGQISEQGKAFVLGRLLEKWLYDHADHITSVARPMSDYISTRTNTPTTVIYNGALSASYCSSEAEAIENRIGYAGNLGRVQGLDVCMRAFSNVVRRGLYVDWTLEFVGGGALESELKKLATELKMRERIKFHQAVAKAIVARWLASSAFLLINLKSDSVLDLTIPSKVFDYMSVGRPILFGLRGVGGAILDSTGANLGFEPSDQAALEATLEQAWAMRQVLEAKAISNRGAVGGAFSREHNTQALIQVFEGAKGSRR